MSQRGSHMHPWKEGNDLLSANSGRFSSWYVAHQQISNLWTLHPDYESYRKHTRMHPLVMGLSCYFNLARCFTINAQEFIIREHTHSLICLSPFPWLFLGDLVLASLGSIICIYLCPSPKLQSPSAGATFFRSPKGIFQVTPEVPPIPDAPVNHQEEGSLAYS